MFDWFILARIRKSLMFFRCSIRLFWLVLDSLVGLSHVLLVYFGSY